ncbi:MAG: YaaA family protein [Muribaculaceae bacterium]|nr:YaaA family protein [Muribaculaceae bacterium]
MIILIAESKTMLDAASPVSADLFLSRCPACEDAADAIMARVSRMSAPEIAALVKVSPAMAAKIVRMAYEFPNKLVGNPAIEAFTGVVFRNFHYASLSPSNREFTDSHVRIISSLYGWLRPTDIIKPYRFDFTTPIAPEGSGPLSTFWRKDVTLQLVRQLQATADTDILNLLPADAARCVDWKIVRRFAKVWKVDFKEPDGTAWRTPNAGRLKAMRGSLLREIATRRISTPDPLLTLATDTILPLSTPDYPDHIAFAV